MDTGRSARNDVVRRTPLDESPSCQSDDAVSRIVISAGRAGTDADGLRRYDPFANSVGMMALKRMITRAASSASTVLITGEKGVGKELVARTLHHESPQLGRPFIKVNCAALPLDSLENELFGHERGAITGTRRRRPGKFELANGGSIFLDDIAEMPLQLQAKLLQVLQDREFSRVGRRHDVRRDVRVIAATKTDLAHLVDQGLFREDLYYRLNVVGLVVPPLRERREEIPTIVEFFLDRYTRQYARPRTVITPATMELFHVYAWPGNIRELENTVKRIVVLGTQDWLAQGLRGPHTTPPRPSPPPATADGDLSTVPTLADHGLSLTAIARAAALQAERGVLKQVLDRVHWNRRAAARVLKVSYRTLRRKIEQCGLAD
jgi:two-component system, NtrC family, response regulator AtoC